MSQCLESVRHCRRQQITRARTRAMSRPYDFLIGTLLCKYNSSDSCRHSCLCTGAPALQACMQAPGDGVLRPSHASRCNPPDVKDLVELPTSPLYKGDSAADPIQASRAQRCAQPLTQALSQGLSVPEYSKMKPVFRPNHMSIYLVRDTQARSYSTLYQISI